MKSLPAIALIAALLLLPACGSLKKIDLFGGPPAPPAVVDNSPAGLMASGQYQKAYAAIQPALARGEAEAVFYTLTIRRNGLDGRAADPVELRVLWDVLLLRADTMRQALRKSDLPANTRKAYSVALAQLAWFSSPARSWPPSPPTDPLARERAAALAARYLGAVVSDYTPAMNFMAHLYLDFYQSPSQAYAATLIAADRGDFLAMGNLAWLLRTGLGIEKNDLRAAQRARDGARSTPPVPRNQNEMGNVYESGLGVSVDLREAARWYEQSAARGHPAGAANAARLKSKKPGSPVLDNVILF